MKTCSVCMDQLKAMQDTAFDHAIEEMNAAHNKTLETKEDRGDRAWLTGMCSKSLGVAVRIEQFMALRERGSGFEPDDPEAEEKRQAAFVKRAEGQLQKIIEHSKIRA